MKHFLSTQDLSSEEFLTLLNHALELKRTRGQRGDLMGKSMTALFFNPSLRTRVSFIRAMEELGGHCTALDVNDTSWKLAYDEGVVMDGAEAEHVREAIPVLGRYSHVLGLRCFGEGKFYAKDRLDPMLHAVARASTVPVINMESAMEHPCQGLADAMTILENRQTVRPRIVLTWAFHPKALPLAVPHSFLLSASRLGADLILAHPEHYDLDPGILSTVEMNSRLSGGTFTRTGDQNLALQGAHFVYAKSWGSLGAYGHPDKERSLRRTYEHWRITRENMTLTSDAKFMHCLPVRRNVVVDDAVLDSAQSIVIDQAENRLHVQKALLLHLLGENT